jgi:hypothetical protein
MEFNRCPSLICGRPYQINAFDPKHSPLADLGKLICPHCGLLISSSNDVAFLTHALSDDEEATFNANNPVVALGETN